MVQTQWAGSTSRPRSYGYGPQFGLIGVDRKTQLRTIKPSAAWLGAIARANSFEMDE
jgi:beta-glucosidase